jgi:dethiobiotin synthetase
MKTGHYIVTGIGTGIGKTVCSAVICEALELDYWKPVQSGDLHALDSDFVKNHTTKTGIIPAVKLLSQPLSPHEAARIDGIKLCEEDFELPHFPRPTLIEGAGGLMVPLNDEGLCYLDVFQHWDLPVYVITRHYLGSINHTLLTLNALYSREIKIAGLVVNGDKNEASERIYRNQFPELHLSYIPELDHLVPETVKAAANQWKEQVL